ncbi:MAG: hypothetical protein HYX97_05650 [Chloroflexi bacterium]|nr:hypothetical protein [Chloroflexota bacterium]
MKAQARMSEVTKASKEEEQFWEGLEHLVDMLLLSRPTRSPGPLGPAPPFASPETWEEACRRMLEQLRRLESQELTARQREALAHAVRRLTGGLEDAKGG